MCKDDGELVAILKMAEVRVSSDYYMCVLILLCPHTTTRAGDNSQDGRGTTIIYMSSYYYVCHSCVLRLLFMWTHTTLCVVRLLYVSSYCCICPHTTIYVSSYYCMCPQTTLYVLKVAEVLLYMCPHTTTIYVSSYCYICVLILLYLSSYCHVFCPQTTKCPHTIIYLSSRWPRY